MLSVRVAHSVFQPVKWFFGPRLRTKIRRFALAGEVWPLRCTAHELRVFPVSDRYSRALTTTVRE